MTVRIQSTIRKSGRFAFFFIALFSFLGTYPVILQAVTSKSSEENFGQKSQGPESAVKDVLLEDPSAFASRPVMPRSSVDFLMEETSPLSAAQPPAIPGFPPLPIEAFQKPEKIVFPMAERCQTNNEGGTVTNFCIQTFSDETQIHIIKDIQALEDETREETTLIELNQEGEEVRRSSLYHGIQYDMTLKGKQKAFEFYDITTEKTKKPVIKEILVYDYSADKHQLQKITWGKYSQAHENEPVSVLYHAELFYDANGHPLRGLVEGQAYAHQYVEFLNWDREAFQDTAVDLDSWHYWEQWILQRPLYTLIS